jgi:cytochrome c553
MIQGNLKNMLLPSFIGAAVLGLALTLLTIVARSPYTHDNLDLNINPRYTRTDQIIVGAPIPFGSGRLAVPLANDQVELGRQLFVADNCASCHGLDGRGGVVGPSIVDKAAKKLRTTTNVGPKGMPAYADGALSDADLNAMAAYLNSVGK